jgi:TonB-linked SusC/RagA family outer membrane protein
MRTLITFAGLLVLTAARPAPDAAAQAASPLDRTISLALEGVTLKDALDEVARRAGVRIGYSRRLVPLDRSVSVRFDAVPVQAVLDTLLRGTGATPTVAGTGQILLVSEAGASKDRARRMQGSIAGVVRDASTAEPLARATVLVVGTRLGAETDAQGRYAIANVPSGTHRVRARMLGYAPTDTSVVLQSGQQATVDFGLRASPIELDPVVSIGYATTRRRDLTGAVASVTAEQLETKAAPTVTLSSSLQGKLAGVQVVSNTGLPGGGLRVRVRGTGSITANSEPLYVIDGLPVLQGTNSSNPQDNPLMSIDADEIESIDVLKDASATAIYGARGANGVVLITTRRGRAGESRVTVESSVGFQEISKRIPVLNARQFMELSNEARINGGQAPLYSQTQIDTARTYDYPAMMLQTAPQSSQSISMSGGTERTRYLLSANYTQQDGIELGSDFERYGIRLNLDSDVGSRFRVGTSLSLARVARNAAAVENASLGNSANGIQAAMQFAPFAAPRDAAGNWLPTSPTTEPVPNPVARATELTDLNTSARLLGSAYAELDITPALRFRSSVGGNFQFFKIHWFAPRTIPLDGGSGGRGWISSSEDRDLTSENTVSYRRALGPGTLDVLGGFSVQTFYNENVFGQGEDFPTDATTVFALGSGAQLRPASSGTGEAAILSYIGRANYSLKDRYLFTATARYDGSSRFGANNKWAVFPSGAFAWRLSEERFMEKQSLFDDLKLRVSYGQVGNQAVESYQSLAGLEVQWYSFGGTEIPALAPGTTMPNPDLRWEQQTQFNAGVDAVLLGGRLALSLDHYRSKTEDLLLSVSVPSTTGFSSQLRNIGSVQNRGVDLSLTSVNLQRDRLRWTSTLNIATNRNRVVDLGIALDTAGNVVPLEQILLSARTGNFFGPSATHILRIGEPLGAIYGYRVIGLWQSGDPCYLADATQCTPGEYKIADVNGDSTITGADRVILGQGDPKFYGGLNNSLSYGRFSLDLFLTFVYGNKIINSGKAYGCFVIMQQNERTCALDRWTPTNANTDVPRANSRRPRRLYSTLVEDGSYVRLQTLTLGYQLPAFIRGVESARLFVTGQNLWILTDYSGFDPDVSSMGGDARFGGIDIGAYPRSRVWNVGLSVTF